MGIACSVAPIGKLTGAGPSAGWAKMEFWVSLCISSGAAIGVLAFAFCLLKFLQFHQRIYLETIRERRGIGGIREPAVPALDELKTHTVCITDPLGKIAMARAGQAAWVVVVQPSESEERV